MMLLRERDKFLNGALDTIDGQPPLSAVARVTRALIHQALPREEADKLHNYYSGWCLFGQTGRQTVAKDFENAFMGDDLRPTPRTVARISEHCLIFAITVMLWTENIGFWSWGEKFV
jgi:hypothetical protein